ncbi:amino acid/polyamine/organocation transporter (APC superfamily) [Mycoplasmopsis mustelae]|uniref:Amino acid/polyamine/organocation transporter (APC superfamily) n=1 Tax=Mycoplasmopsis mustelae TaxID=171289 RepID=A0A4R7UEI8_9BACT|nr:APC family permease [Mycoplasmopsis mustelae]TDV24341.1 amino acid/polyamine/organocation transporter (APC superfamily) [Mycoplasmopsis mustelae]
MKIHKKIGLFVSLMLIVGSVVGIGIFFKNLSISRVVEGNGVSWLLAWIIGGIISLSAALSFAEIGSFKKTKLVGLSNWAYKVSGSRFGYFTAVNYSTFYMGILATVLGIFGSEIIFKFIATVSNLDFNKIHIGVHILVGFLLVITFLVINHYSVRTVGIMQSLFTVLKFIPLLAALLIGIIFPNTHNSNPSGVNAFVSGSFSFKAVVSALPAVLFAYDAFLTSASLSHKMKKPSKTLPKAILLGMILVLVTYTLIAVSTILHNKGYVGDLLRDSLPKTVAIYIEPIILFFLIISTLGVINGLTSAFFNEVSNVVNTKLLFASKWFVNRFGLSAATFIYIGFILGFWSLSIFIPSFVLNSDILIDAGSGYPTIFFFNIYALIIALYAFKRGKIEETTKINKVLFYISAVFTVIGIAVLEIVYLVAVFTFLTEPNKSNPNGWGLFADRNSAAFPFYLPVVYIIINILFFLVWPYINLYLERKFFGRHLIKEFSSLIMIDEKEEHPVAGEKIVLPDTGIVVYNNQYNRAEKVDEKKNK